MDDSDATGRMITQKKKQASYFFEKLADRRNNSRRGAMMVFTPDERASPKRDKEQPLSKSDRSMSMSFVPPFRKSAAVKNRTSVMNIISYALIEGKACS